MFTLRTVRRFAILHVLGPQVANFRPGFLNLEHGIAHEPGKFLVQTYNKISPLGLAKFDSKYNITDVPNTPNTHAIVVRSHKLKESQVPPTVRCIARCGAGTNNIPVERMTELGIPVFNTPGANANAVKELVLCGLLLSSRGIIQGINHMKVLGAEGVAKERVEKDKALFGGQELKGKTVGFVGLGHIGAATARDCAGLGMRVIGYDPNPSFKSALILPASTVLVNSLEKVFRESDYISLNIPYIKGTPAEGGTHGIINRDVLMLMKKNASVLNFARGELVDSMAMKEWFDNGGTGRYVSDFPDDILWNHPNAIILPHLGASTYEAEDAAASMAAETICSFLESGEIQNSVNFPETKLEMRTDENTVRITVVNENKSGVLAGLLNVVSEAGLNILQQVNKSRGDIAYNVIDVARVEAPGNFNTWGDLQRALTMADGVISTRFIAKMYGFGYAKKVKNAAGELEYFV